MDHVSGAGTNASQMILYITSDVATSGTVSFTDGTASIPYTVAANVVTFVPIPATQFLGTEGIFSKGVHITALKPIAVYAHIYASSVSGATLLLPVNTLGKNYYSINYTQLSNTNPSYSTFAVIATEDATTVEITPSALLNSGHVAGVAFTVVLNKGQVYQGLSATDLTGTKIKSVSSGAGTASCKKIAVFSGSSKIGIGNYNAALGTNAQSLSSDNLFQQVYPIATWGKNYITVSLKARNYDIYRIVLSDPATTVTLNGVVIPATAFTNGLYYEFSTQGVKTNVITADKPVQVAQYTPTQNQTLPHPATAAEAGGGDPEMIYLSPIEQGLDHVTLYSTGYYLILNSYVNVVIPTSAVSTFTLDGAAYTAFTPVPNNTAYSYAQIPVTSGPKSPLTTGTTAGTHNLKASVPFNAIAYGFGSAESYGYAAGTNLINLNESITLASTSGNGTTSANGCVNSPYVLQLTLPYKPTSLKWDFKDNSTPVVDAAPVAKTTTVKGAVTLYTYECSTPLTYTKSGDYSVVATATNPLGDDCSTNEDIEFNFNISDLPVATFSKNDACLGTATTFTDQSGSNVKSWDWDFGDGTPHGNTSTVNHAYAAANDYTVTLTVTNENGCSSTSSPVTVHISALPQAAFTYTKPDCDGLAIAFTDLSTPGDGTLNKWDWDFGDGSHSTIQNPSHVYSAAGKYPITLTVTSSSGCSNIINNQMIDVRSTPQADFTLPTACLAGATAQFADITPVTSTTGTPFKYSWDFGDASASTAANPNTSALQNPTHFYIAAGKYKVVLTVTTADGCSSVSTHDYLVTGKANFTVQASACPAEPVKFTDITDPSNTTVTGWHWDFKDGSTSTDQNPTHAFAPGDYNVSLTVDGNNGCSSTTYTMVSPLHVTSNPQAKFTYDAITCEKQTIHFKDQSSTAEGTIVKWDWDFGDGSAHSTDQNPTHTYLAWGPYTVNLQVTKNTGCVSDIISQQITVHPLPSVDFVLPDACLKDTPQFLDASSIADGSENGFKYNWLFGDSNANAANPNSSTAKNPLHRFTEARDDTNPYLITLQVTSQDGCTIPALTKPFTVNGEFPKASFSADMPEVCSSDDAVFTNTSTVSFGKLTKVVMYWDANDLTNTTTYVKEEAQPGFKMHHNYGLTNTGGPKTYQAKMFAYTGSSASCSGVSALVPIVVKPNPIITVTQLAPLCRTDNPVTIPVNLNGFTGTGTFTGSVLSGGTAGIAKNNFITANGVFNPLTAGPGTFRIYYNFVAANTGCGYTTYQDVIVYPTPVITAGNAEHLLEGGSLKLNATNPNNELLTYKWTMADGSSAVTLDHDDVLNPIASPVANVTYKLTATSVNGCTASATVDIVVLKIPVVPNTFTPNGDGLNDKWEIKYLDTYPNATVDIFTRSGVKIYSSVGYATGWDGTYKGEPLPVGTYYYIINPKNGRKAISGSVTIIR